MLKGSKQTRQISHRLQRLGSCPAQNAGTVRPFRRLKLQTKNKNYLEVCHLHRFKVKRASLLPEACYKMSRYFVSSQSHLKMLRMRYEPSIFEVCQKCKFQRVAGVCHLKNFHQKNLTLLRDKKKTVSYLFLDSLTAIHPLGSNHKGRSISQPSPKFQVWTKTWESVPPCSKLDRNPKK